MNHYDVGVEYNRENISNILSFQNETVHACNIIEIVSISKNINLSFPIRNILSFKLTPSFLGMIHKDVVAGSNHSGPIFALNLPISYCDGTYMRWFEQKQKDETLVFSGPSAGDTTPMSTHDNSVCIDVVSCYTPKIVDVTNWHSIDNNLAEYYSHIISVRFARRISINDVMNRE